MQQKKYIISIGGEARLAFSIADKAVRANMLAAMTALEAAVSETVDFRFDLKDLCASFSDCPPTHRPQVAGPQLIHRDWRASNVWQQHANIKMAAARLYRLPTHYIDQGLRALSSPIPAGRAYLKAHRCA